jgi:hypothetical protein
MNHPLPETQHKKFVLAAAASVAAIDSCRPVLSEISFPQNVRAGIAAALLCASIDQARSASFLIANDPARSTFGALILLRSQVDQLMRSAFFAGPASDEELAFYLDKDELPKRDKYKLGPISLAQINELHFNWGPVGRVPKLIKDSWDILCGLTHGGHALLAYYNGEDGIGQLKPNDDLISELTNSVALTHIGVTIAMSMATNEEAPSLQKALNVWQISADAYFSAWGPKQNSVAVS